MTLAITHKSAGTASHWLDRRTDAIPGVNDYANYSPFGASERERERDLTGRIAHSRQSIHDARRAGLVGWPAGRTIRQTQSRVAPRLFVVRRQRQRQHFGLAADA